MEIAIAQGKKEFDKRDSIKDRESKREMDRAMKVQSVFNFQLTVFKLPIAN